MQVRRVIESSIALTLGPPTEGFYDAAVTDAVKFESRKANDTPAPLEPQTKVCPKGLCVKTMLGD